VALVRPLGALVDEAPDYVQLIARLFADFGRSDRLTALPAARWFSRVEELVQDGLGLSPGSTRWRFAITLTVHAVAEQARQAQVRDLPPTDAFVEELVDAVAAVLRGS
jgi:hypothetical protein